MDQPEEPMELDSSVSYIEMDNSKLDDTTDSKIFVNDSNDSKIDEPDSVSEDTRHENKNNVTLTTGIEIFSKEEKVRMEERAKRFGLGEQNNKAMIEEEGPEIYADLGIVEEDDALKNLRLNVLHMRGTEEMSTKDVFKYFEDFSPASIEWINDISCNVVWLDNVTAAKALLQMSKKIEGLGEKVKADKISPSETSNFDDANDTANEDCVVEIIGDEPMDEAGDKKNESTINIRDIKCPLPPGLWRKGVECPKSKCILLRFATRADKKQPNAEKLSDYYKKHGNPNFGGIRGILTASRKRLIKESKHGRKRIKPDEQLAGVGGNQGSKNPWGTLSQSWGVNDFTEEEFINKNFSKDQGTSVKERLGFKPSSKELALHSEESGSSSDAGSEDEWCKRSKVMRMRMHADDEEAKVRKRRQQIKHQVATIRGSRTDDLRSRLGSSRRPPAIFRDAIQVVVTNNQMVLPDSPNNNRSEEEDEEEQEEEEQEEEEQEEGEIIDEIEVPVKQEKIDSWEEEEEDEEEEEEDDDEDEEEEEESDESEKEVQGPRGSVIKVVQKHKPRVASTVWARLNTKPEESKAVKQRRSTKGDLRETLRGDLRSRLGKQSKARSPLRIEVKNDKYANNESDSE